MTLDRRLYGLCCNENDVVTILFWRRVLVGIDHEVVEHLSNLKFHDRKHEREENCIQASSYISTKFISIELHVSFISITFIGIGDRKLSMS